MRHYTPADRHISYVVEASAGTGKTTRLVNRIIELVCAGARIDKIVAVTFTNAAAGDMKVRLREELDRELSQSLPPDQRSQLVHALEHLEKAFIGTIHSFCASMLRQRPVEACLDPRFQELAEMQSARLFSGIFRGWLEERLASGSPVLNRAMCRLSYMEDRREDPAHRLQEEATRLANWRDMDRPWTRRLFERETEIERLLDNLLVVAEVWRSQTNLNRVPKGLRDAAQLASSVDLQRKAGRPDYDEYEATLCSIGQKEADIDDFRFEKSGELFTADFGSWQQFRAAACRFRESADADFAAALRNELWQVVERYQDAKLRGGQADFTDLLVAARDLMQNDSVRSALQARYDHILVDEFQDTDPIQAEVLVLLAAMEPSERNWRKAKLKPGKLFIVGDPKQSIYRFRRADVELYRGVCRQAIESGAETERRQSSYRSLESIQRFVNAAFKAMPDYLPLRDGRDSIDEQPGIVALPILNNSGKRGKPAKYVVERQAPSITAGFIEWLVRESGYKICKKEGEVPVQPKDICILFRRFQTETTADYVRAFERRNIPHLLIGSKSLHDREEVEVIRNALTAIEWPQDEFSVYATLRGQLFAVTDFTLALYRHRHNRLNPLKIPDDARLEFPAIYYALDVIAQLHRSRNFEPLSVIISRLLKATRAHAGFAFRPGGGRVLGNVNRLIDLARRFDATMATSFRSFVEFLESEAAVGEATEAPLLEHEGEGVRLMTVHKAKGLEFPIVILADPTFNLVGASAGNRWVDPEQRLCAQTLLRCAPWEVVEHQEQEKQAERDEAWRVAYVAATRARDLLVVTTAGLGLGEGWLSPLYPTLEASQDVSLFDTKLLTREPEMFDGLEASTRVILEGDPAVGLQRYRDWADNHAAAISAGAKKSADIVAATQIHWDDEDELSIEVVRVDTGMNIKSSRRLGKLVHALVQDLGHETQDLEAMAHSHGRRLRASNDEIAGALKAVLQLAKHPSIAPGVDRTIFREFPFIFRKDGQIIEGTIDLAISTKIDWTIIDFKVGSADAAKYDRQMQVYATAMRTATNFPVRAQLLEIT